MAQSFMVAIVAFVSCFVLTVVISLCTRPKDKESLVGLVYSLTPRPVRDQVAWYRRPVSLGIVVLVLTLILNLIFL
jgi:SSS family solute:Na+ symporter